MNVDLCFDSLRINLHKDPEYCLSWAYQLLITLMLFVLLNFVQQSPAYMVG